MYLSQKEISIKLAPPLRLRHTWSLRLYTLQWRIAMEVESERTKPVAVFMAFGTKGDVYPIAVSHPFLPFISLPVSVWVPGKCKKFNVAKWFDSFLVEFLILRFVLLCFHFAGHFCGFCLWPETIRRRSNHAFSSWGLL